MDWYPAKPAVPQVALGIVLFVALAGLAIYWSIGEEATGNQVVLWILAALLITLATWRVWTLIRLVRERDGHHG